MVALLRSSGRSAGEVEDYAGLIGAQGLKGHAAISVDLLCGVLCSAVTMAMITSLIPASGLAELSAGPVQCDSNPAIWGAFLGLAFVQLGSLVDPSGITPGLEMFVKRRLAWVTPLDMPQFDGMPA